MPRERKTPRPEDMLSETLCRCTHQLGDHRSTTLRQCTAPGCNCERFRFKPTPSSKVP